MPDTDQNDYSEPEELAGYDEPSDEQLSAEARARLAPEPDDEPSEP